MTSLAKAVFEFCGIFAFAMAFYFLGKITGTKSGYRMCLKVVEEIGKTCFGISDKDIEELEDDAFEDKNKVSQ